MKKLRKLSINPEKVIKNEDLLNLKGGYTTTIKCYSEGWSSGCMGFLGEIQGDCNKWQLECYNAGHIAYCAEC